MAEREDLAHKLFGDDFTFYRQRIPQSRQGLIAYSDEITVNMVLSAYLQGMFPWYNENEGEIPLWWSPDPRFVLFPEKFHIPKSLSKSMKKTPFKFTFDRDFPAVMNECGKVERPGQSGTWIGKQMLDIYCQIAEMGFAHSVEVWHDEKLVGGLYGVLIGKVFFGESMFSLEDNASKSALVIFEKAFVQAGGKLIDSQVYTDNLSRFGAENISRDAFFKLEDELLPAQLEKNLADEFRMVAGTFENADKKN